MNLVTTRRDFLLGMFAGAAITAAGGWSYLHTQRRKKPAPFDEGRGCSPLGYGFFLGSLVPVGEPAYESVAKDLLDRLQQLRGRKAEALTCAVNIFGQRLDPERLARLEQGADETDLRDAQGIFAELLEDPSTMKPMNAGLDVFYETIAKSPRFGEILIGRKYSEPGNRCLYWEDYDRPPQTRIGRT